MVQAHKHKVRHSNCPWQPDQEMTDVLHRCRCKRPLESAAVHPASQIRKMSPIILIDAVRAAESPSKTLLNRVGEIGGGGGGGRGHKASQRKAMSNARPDA